MTNQPRNLTTNADHAAEYAARGWHVFPAPPSEKKSHIAKEHDPQGRRWGATADPEEVRRYFQKWPGASIGIATGAQSDFFVIEADTPKGHGVDGIANLAALIEEHGPLPDTIEALSPSGSRHIYFNHPGGVVQNSAGKIATGVDVRGDGGMVIAPPSVKPGEAKAYRWKNPPGMFDLADCPEWLLALAMRVVEKPTPVRPIDAGGVSAWAQAAWQAEVGRVAMAQPGQRNETLNDAAFRLGQIVAGGGLTEGAVTAALYRAAMAAGLEAAETEATIASGLRAGMQTPRGPEERAADRPAAARADPPALQSAPMVPTRAAQFAASIRGFDDLTPTDPAYCIKGWLPADALGLIFGPSGSGKSFLALDMALHIAADLPWRCHRVRQGSVLYIAGEGAGGFGNRVSAWLREHPDARAEAERRFFGLTIRNDLCGDADAPAILVALASLQDRMGGYPALIIIDTLARSMGAGDENSGQDMGAFIANIDLLRASTGAAVLVVHHSGKGENRGARGHSSLRAAVDCEIEVSRKDDLRTAKLTKARDWADGAEAAFTLRRIVLGTDRDGDEIASCVVEEAEPAEKPSPRSRLTGKPLVALQALDDALAQHGRKITVDGLPGCPVVELDRWRDMCRSHGLTASDGAEAQKKAFQRVRADLIEKGLVRCFGAFAWRAIE